MIVGLERRSWFQRNLRTRVDNTGDCLYVENEGEWVVKVCLLSGLNSCVNGETIYLDVTQKEKQICREILFDFGHFIWIWEVK